MKNKIYSLGAVVLDHVISVEEIPKKPVKMKGRQYIKRLGGPGAVASVVVASLGFNSFFIGRFGRDSDSLFLKDTLLVVVSRNPRDQETHESDVVRIELINPNEVDV